jgi:hypothetical protein
MAKVKEFSNGLKRRRWRDTVEEIKLTFQSLNLQKSV